MPKIEISEELESLFLDEIDNEHDEETGNSRSGSSSPGGVNPATLESTLDSLNQGVYDDEDLDVEKMAKQLEALIAEHGGETEVREFLD